MKEEIFIDPDSQKCQWSFSYSKLLQVFRVNATRKPAYCTLHSTALLGYHCASTVYSPYRTKPACRWETFALPAALLHSTRIIFGQQLKQALHYTLHYALH